MTYYSPQTRPMRHRAAAYEVYSVKVGYKEVANKSSQHTLDVDSTAIKHSSTIIVGNKLSFSICMYIWALLTCLIYFWSLSICAKQPFRLVGYIRYMVISMGCRCQFNQNTFIRSTYLSKNAVMK